MGDLERLAASYLCDKNDSSLMTWKELKDGWGGPLVCTNFMISYGLKPFNPEDCEEAVAISRALKEGNNESEDPSN